MSIVCEDDVVGIPEEQKDTLFRDGHGFGLFLSREIPSITGITISEEIELGQGVRLVIRIPQGASEMPDLEHPVLTEEQKVRNDKP